MSATAPDPTPQVCAGGVVVRQHGGRHEVCLVLRDRHGPRTWTLPKGHVESNEDVKTTALREVGEETGLTGLLLAPLPTIRYRFALKDDQTRYEKTVHFFLIRALEGNLHDHDAEVLEARWMSFEEAQAQLTYDNERRVLDEARLILERSQGTDRCR